MIHTDCAGSCLFHLILLVADDMAIKGLSQKPQISLRGHPRSDILAEIDTMYMTLNSQSILIFTQFARFQRYYSFCAL